MEKSLSEKISILSRIPMFSELNGPEIAFLAEVACERDIAEGETLIFEGDKTKSLFVVIDGKANATGVRSGKRIVLNSFKTGDCFGEMSFLDGEPRCASVEMTETGRVLEIDSEKFRDSIGANPDFVFGITKGLLRKLRDATSHIENLEFVMGHQELHDAHLDTIKRLVLAAECKDNNTCNHVIRVGRYSLLIAEGLGFDDRDAQIIRYAAPMHDIGKIGISRDILQKPGKLTKEEFEIMKTHTTIGGRILTKPKSDILKCAYDIALWHHERFDGKGYPDGLSGEAIPVSARIVGVADVFDALVSCRSYKDAFTVENAVDIIREERGKHFDPDIADVFLANSERVRSILVKFGQQQNCSLFDIDDF